MTQDLTKKYGQVTAIIGGQWGDEGKGKLVDILAEQYPLIVRSTGGANAGHTVYIQDPVHPNEKKKFVFHLMPSGVLYPQSIGIIGNGCVLHIPTFLEEVKFLRENNIEVKDRVFISDRVHLTFEYHKIIDGLQEDMKGKNKVGTTRRGIGPSYTDKIARRGIRIHELLDLHKFEEHLRENVEELKKHYDFELDLEKEINYYREILPEIKPYIKDTASYIDQAIKQGKTVLLEGANGTMLDVDHGTYPYVTSSNATIGGIIAGCGIGATHLKSVIAIMKAYCTRVGSGPFPTEQENPEGEKMRNRGGEFGSTTGRPRRCGWFDAVAARYAIMINGVTQINLTKLDVLDDFDIIRIGTGYMYKGEKLENYPSAKEILEEVEVTYIEMPGWKKSIQGIKEFSQLPIKAQNYVKKLEEILECPIDSIGVGLMRDDMIFV